MGPKPKNYISQNPCIPERVPNTLKRDLNSELNQGRRDTDITHPFLVCMDKGRGSAFYREQLLHSVFSCKRNAIFLIMVEAV
jgi:hypothetical protein